MMDLDEKLIAYGKSGAYPFHMPGAKRMGFGLPDPYEIDITEIDGFDNLNSPEDLYVDLNERVARLYHADRAFLMVNGSTGGNYVMMHVVLKPGDTILVARNCHKSVFRQIELRRLRSIVLPSEMYSPSICGVVSPELVRQTLEEHPEIKAFLLTSPTYEGISSDIPALAKVCHEAGIPLLVDAAHGAHFTVGGAFFPKNPIEEGADLVVVSLHKTLPALTQTAAVLYKKNSFVTPEQVASIVPYYETSSPSYVLMASVARCVRYLEEEGEVAFQVLDQRLRNFYERIKGLERMVFMSPENHDYSKIVICPQHMSGIELMNLLREKYSLEAEYALEDRVLLMVTLCDREDGFQRLGDALLQIDKMERKPEVEKMALENTPLDPPKKVLEIYEAAEENQIFCQLKDAVGQVAAEQIAIYPPGVPICLPGERITKEIVRSVDMAIKYGSKTEGIDKKRRIRIVELKTNN